MGANQIDTPLHFSLAPFGELSDQPNFGEIGIGEFSFVLFNGGYRLRVRKIFRRRKFEMPSTRIGAIVDASHEGPIRELAVIPVDVRPQLGDDVGACRRDLGPQPRQLKIPHV